MGLGLKVVRHIHICFKRIVSRDENFFEGLKIETVFFE
jgi:hypothetical protein